MVNLRLIIFSILFSTSLSCSKDATKRDSLIPDVEFNELGSDGPYIYGETYYGRKDFGKKETYAALAIHTLNKNNNKFSHTIKDRKCLMLKEKNMNNKKLKL